MKKIADSAKRILTSNKFLVAWTIMYTLLLLCRTITQVCKKELLIGDNYDFADLFINYEGGFVRRGLLGEMLYGCYEMGINPIWVAIVLAFAAYITIATYMIRQFCKRGYNICLLTMSYLLGAFGMYGFTAMRRDYMILCVFLFLVTLWKRMSIRHWLCIANVIVIVTILCYEPFALFAIPYCILLAHLRLKRWGMSVILWIPAFVAFAACCMHPGNQETFDGIWNVAKNYLASPGIITFLTRDTGNVMWSHFSTNFLSFKHHIPVIFFTIPSILYLLYYCCNAAPVYCSRQDAWGSRRYVLALLLTGIIFLSPMLPVLSIDYGRTMGYVVLSGFIIYFSLSQEDVQNLLPQRMYLVADKVISWCDAKVPPTRIKIVCLMLFSGMMYCTLLGLQAFLIQTEFVTVLQSAWRLFKRVYVYLN